MSDAPLTVSHDGAIAILTLDRPASGNAIDLEMAEALQRAADRLHADNRARVVLLRANGSLFSGGGDIKAFTAALGGGPAAGSAYLAELAPAFHRAWLRLLDYDAPIVAAVQGPAAGAGMSLVLGADFSYLAPPARLVPAYAAIGLCGDGGVTWLLPRLCGMRKATEILMLNTPVGPAEAVSLGLVTEALAQEGEAFQDEVLARARRLASGPHHAFGVVRRLLRTGATGSFADQLAREAEGMARLGAGPELPEGLQAMREKRPPVFV